MRSVEDKKCYSNGTSQEVSNNGNMSSFEFHRGNGTNHSSHQHHHRTALGKPTPSKWDDAQKWLIGLSRSGESKYSGQSKTKPRNSNADDLRLIAPVPQREQGCSSPDEEDVEYEAGVEVETKKVECDDESIWRINKTSNSQGRAVSPAVRSICVRDMGTEMTPIASQEPSRTATPIRASTPVGRSPINSGASTPARCNESHQYQMPVEGRPQPVTASSGGCENNSSVQAGKLNPLETRAIAWDEAERAKYMASIFRYKREEVKIQAWENHEKRKAEMQMKKMEVKAERMKARAQEKLTNKIASTRRIAEEKRANAEAKLNEKAVRTSERADYIRRTGHLPSSLSLKLPSFCR